MSDNIAVLWLNPGPASLSHTVCEHGKYRVTSLPSFDRDGSQDFWALYAECPIARLKTVTAAKSACEKDMETR